MRNPIGRVRGTKDPRDACMDGLSTTATPPLTKVASASGSVTMLDLDHPPRRPCFGNGRAVRAHRPGIYERTGGRLWAFAGHADHQLAVCFTTPMLVSLGGAA